MQILSQIKLRMHKMRKKLRLFLLPAKKYALFEYKNPKGQFDYELYKKIQEAGNKRKIDRSWVTEEEMRFLAPHILKYTKRPRFGVCHGTRRGLEQRWLSKYLGDTEVIGTEISETAKSFPNTIQWDFHEEKEEWIGKVDFVYSNSFDHSYDPKKSLSTWMRSLKPGGVCIIQHSKDHTPDTVNQLDPFGASIDIMPYLILKWSEGKYSVREMIESPHIRNKTKSIFFVIKNNEPYKC